jgi:hypothetical protein
MRTVQRVLQRSSITETQSDVWPTFFGQEMALEVMTTCWDVTPCSVAETYYILKFYQIRTCNEFRFFSLLK